MRTEQPRSAVFAPGDLSAENALFALPSTQRSISGTENPRQSSMATGSSNLGGTVATHALGVRYTSA